MLDLSSGSAWLVWFVIAILLIMAVGIIIWFALGSNKLDSTNYKF